MLERTEQELSAVNYESLMPLERIDWHLLRNRIEYELQQLNTIAAREQELAPMLPFAAELVELEDGRRRLDDPPADARDLSFLPDESIHQACITSGADVLLPRRYRTGSLLWFGNYDGRSTPTWKEQHRHRHRSRLLPDGSALSDTKCSLE